MAPKFQVWRLVCRDCHEAQSPTAWEYQLPFYCACGGEMLHRDTGESVGVNLIKRPDPSTEHTEQPILYTRQFTKNADDINIIF